MRLWLTILATMTGVFGAAGVGLAAAGAHLSSEPIITTAANFLLFHAAALAGLCAVLAVRPAKGLFVGATMIAAGASVFSGDLALRGLAKIVLVHKAAPAGGVLMIAGWLIVAVALPVALRHADDGLRSN